MAMASKIGLQTGNSVWYGPEIKIRENEWLYHVTKEELEELRVGADQIIAASPPDSNSLSLEILDSLDSFQLPKLTSKIQQFSKQLNDGLGFFLWRGIPVKEWGHKRSAAAFLLIGRCLGNLRQQNGKGHVLGHVKDLGLASNDPNVRVYQTSERQTFHTDSCDVVGLLCLQTAKSGGLSALVSSSTVFNEMLKNMPDLADELLKPFPKDRRGEIPEGALPYYVSPVYNYHEGHLSAIYQRQYIDSAARFFADSEHLSKKQVAALDAFDTLNDDPRLHFTMELQVGDMQFVNNHSLLHDRTGFTDWEDPDKKRHLLRVWIAPENARPLPEVYAQRYGNVVVGQRGGVHVKGVQSVAPLHP